MLINPWPPSTSSRRTLKSFLFLSGSLCTEIPSVCHRSKPCPNLRKGLGSTILSHPRWIPRRLVSSETSSAQYPTVCQPMRQTIRAHLIRPVFHFREGNRSILPMHERFVQSRQSCKKGYQAGTRYSHGSHFTVSEDRYHIDPRPSIHLLR